MKIGQMYLFYTMDIRLASCTCHNCIVYIYVCTCIDVATHKPEHTVSGTSPCPGMKRAACRPLLGVNGAACELGLLPASICSSCVLPQPLVPNNKQLNTRTPHPTGLGRAKLPADLRRGPRTSSLSAAVVPRGCRDLHSLKPQQIHHRCAMSVQGTVHQDTRTGLLVSIDVGTHPKVQLDQRGVNTFGMCQDSPGTASL